MIYTIDDLTARQVSVHKDAMPWDDVMDLAVRRAQYRGHRQRVMTVISRIHQPRERWFWIIRDTWLLEEYRRTDPAMAEAWERVLSLATPAMVRSSKSGK